MGVCCLFLSATLIIAEVIHNKFFEEKQIQRHNFALSCYFDSLTSFNFYSIVAEKIENATLKILDTW